MEARWVRSARFVERSVAEHHLLLAGEGALPSGVMALLLDGPVAHLLWDALAVAQPVSALVARVVDEYDVAPADAERDVAAFLEQLARAGCAERVEVEPGAAAGYPGGTDG